MDFASTAVLFPGQGSQTADMRDSVERTRPDLVELATAEVGSDPFERVDEGTRFAQPALYCASLAGWTRLEYALGEPDCFAGHSLGEFAALAAAGSLSAEDGLRLVILRGRLMQAAAERTSDGGMLALLGDRDVATEIGERAGLVLANDNAPFQIVLSGPDEGVALARLEAESRGLRAIRLSVRGAFHSPALESVVPEFRSALDDTEITPPRTPVFSSLTARPFDDVRRNLADALTAPVRWRETLIALRERGIERYVEVGPGRVLTGLAKRTLPDADAIAADSLESAVHA